MKQTAICAPVMALAMTGGGEHGVVMNFLDASIKDATATWATDPDPHQRSCAHNLLMEARVSPTRLAAFEADVAPVRDPSDLRRRATDYYETFVRVSRGVPHTFQDLNSTASPGTLSPEQKLVRLEAIGEALDKTGIGFDDLQRALNRHDRGSNTLVQFFLDQWNYRPDIRRNPVSFAAFKEHLFAEVEKLDWPDELRDRLGLPHLDPAAGPIAVALMEYEVSEVLDTTEPVGASHVFCVPTALDAQPYAQFVPTPLTFTFGCPMALFLAQSDEELIAEILHPRLSYRRRNLTKLGFIQRAPPLTDFVELRNNHLWALRIAALDDAFGLEL